MPLLSVRLRDDEYEALQILARSQRRPTRDQLAVLVVQGLAAALRQPQENIDQVAAIHTLEVQPSADIRDAVVRLLAELDGRRVEDLAFADACLAADAPRRNRPRRQLAEASQ